MKTVIIQKSHRQDKKFDAFVNGEKIVSFGQKGAEDYTMHKDGLRKERYILRHQKREDWTNPLTSGFYAYYVLWNKKTLKESIEDMNRRFKNYHFVLRS
jgi:ribosomal protein S6